MRVRFLAPAAAEYRDAREWYAVQSPLLEKRLINELRNAQRKILEYPNAWQPLNGGVRRYRLERFPYGIIYNIRENEILVVAFAHLHRNPDYWRDRLPK